MINVTCPLCKSTEYKRLYDVSNPRVHADSGLPGIIKKCKKCGLLYKTFSVKAETLYAGDYAERTTALKEYAGIHAIDFYKKILQPVYNRLVKSDLAKPLLLDIGSGLGVMLTAAKEIGYEPTGVELSPKLAEITRQKGFNVINKNISEIALTNKFDTITMMDLIEHLEDPKQILMNLKSLIKPAGELIIYTPDHASLIVKVSRIFYNLGIKSPIENIFACNHTCFFTTKTLRKIVESSGYRVLAISHYNYDTSRPGQEISPLAKVAVNVIDKIGNLIGLNGFRVVIVAKPL